MDLDLVDTLRSTGAVRQFHPEPVDDDVLARLLDTARFAPSGGNRQGWRVIVVKDPVRRAALRDLYLSGWYEYLAIAAAGLVPWAPVTDREAEAAATADAARFAEARCRHARLRRDARHRSRPAARPGRPAPRWPRSTATCARYTLAGGASIYPFVWSLLLAARSEGLGGVMTTMPVRREDDVRARCSASPTPLPWRRSWCWAARCRPHAGCGGTRSSSFAWVDRFGGAPARRHGARAQPDAASGQRTARARAREPC